MLSARLPKRSVYNLEASEHRGPVPGAPFVPNRLRDHRFRGIRYRILYAVADPDTAGVTSFQKRTISFRPTLSLPDFLDTAIHESLHACFPDLDETSVGEAAGSIASLLTRAGLIRPTT